MLQNATWDWIITHHGRRNWLNRPEGPRWVVGGGGGCVGGGGGRGERFRQTHIRLRFHFHGKFRMIHV